MEYLILTAARRPVAVIMALGAILLAGAIAFAGLPLNRLPPVAVPRILVEAPFPGLGAGELRSLVAIPLEDAVSPVRGLTGITSVSRDGRVSLTLGFRWGENPERAALRVREAIDAAWPSLPAGLEKPLVLAAEASDEPLLVVAVSPVAGAAPALSRRLAERDLRTRLRRVDGVSSVVLVGGTGEEILVSLDLERAASRSLTAADAAGLLSRETAELPAGKLPEGEKESVLVASGRPTSIEELSRLLLPAPSGPVRLDQIARVGLVPAPMESAFLRNGDGAVALEVRCRADADPVSCARALRAEIAGARRDLGASVRIEIVEDGSGPIWAEIASLAASALLGAALSILLIFLFLGDLRVSLLSLLTLPVSLAVSFAALALTGRTLNSVSLGGIALGIGLISDNAVVVLSSLSSAFSRQAHQGAPAQAGSADSAKAVISARAAASVAFPTLTGTLTSVAVFAPVLVSPGPVGALFSDVAVSLIAAILASWLVALFALPALYTAFFRQGERRPVARYERWYRSALARALRRPAGIFALSILFSVAALVSFAARGLEFVPTSLPDRVIISARFPPGYRLEAIAREGAILSRELSRANGVASCYGRSGAEADDLLWRSSPGYEREELCLTCLLSPGAKPRAVLASVADICRTIPTAAILAASLPPDPVSRILGQPGPDASSRLVVRGRDCAEAEGRALEVSHAVAESLGPALLSMEIEPRELREGIAVSARAERSSRLDLSLADITETLRTASEGVKLSDLEIAGIPRTLRLRGDCPVPPAIPVAIAPAGPIPASTVVSFSPRTAASALLRVDRADALYLDVQAAPGQSGTLSAALSREQNRFPFLEKAGGRDTGAQTSALALTLVLVVILLYLLLAAQFESLVFPLMVLSALPLAILGAVLALAAFRTGFDSGAMIGLVVLFGTSGNGTLVMYEQSLSIAAGGAGWGASAWMGATLRLRAVLVTSLTTALSLVPVVLMASPGPSRSMAVALLGGTAASAATCLFLSPLLFARFARLGRRGRP